MFSQLARFGAVGFSALAVHWLIVAALVPLGMTPLRASFIAFLIAFQVSYWGHRLWTFGAGHLSHRATLPRSLVAAGTSFAVKQSLYFLFLRYTTLDYRVSLLIVLIVMATLSFLLNKKWAFR